MDNIMLGIETLDNGSNEVVASIGAIFFAPLTGADFDQVIDINGSVQYDDIELSTIIWWMKQSEAAQEIFEDQVAIPLSEALFDFTTWITGNLIAESEGGIVWGNGPSFDSVIVRNAYKTIAIDAPWVFFNDGDVRTVADSGVQLSGIYPQKTIAISTTSLVFDASNSGVE